MYFHFLHFETVELILDLLRELWCQAIASSRLAPPVIDFRVKGVVDGTLGRPVDVSFFDGRRGYRSVWPSPVRRIERHTSQNRSRSVHTRMGVWEVQTVRQRLPVDIAFERREGLRKGIVG